MNSKISERLLDELKALADRLINGKILGSLTMKLFKLLKSHLVLKNKLKLI